MKTSSIRLPIDGNLQLEVEDLPRPPSRGLSTISLATRVRRRSRSRRWPVGLVVNRQTRESGAELTVRVTGDIDRVTAPTLAEALDRARRDISQLPGTTEMVVDLRSVPFLSASGIHALVDTQDACTADGTSLRVVADQTAVTRPLTLTGLNRVLNLQPSLPR